jgi:hypothetical protein
MRSDATPADLPRKKPNILWWIGGIFVLVVLWFIYQLFGPSPRISNRWSLPDLRLE